ncbi:MAG: fructose-1,6-bisphosphatase [Methanoregula sp.]|uniref:class 1 fructose-bisphosphatase n=1 Tax=Methanoregula sp. TaxID=2052170 RepID=UPI0025E81F06|nr:class 1 fructose-bisphosphatase [Methanoregula sp.]MCK9630402.1 fructose-1,6-bisphosphatase [Methanoregula sp.]
MKLKDFLVSEGTEKNLADLILFLSEQAPAVRKGFLVAGKKAAAGEKTRNVYGEEQMPLDKYADAVFIDGLKKSRLARYVATEEQEQVVEIANPKAGFGVVIDPLDGSSLIDVNLCVGTIIGIYPGHVLEKGSTMVAAMYMLYGPLTSLTFTTGKGVHEFAMDDTGEFVLRQRDLRIPEGKVFAPGALRKDYLPAHARWIAQLEQEGYKLRFSGCFVADVHQILHKGGVFTYPGTRGKEKGKLRLLYEANPMGTIIHHAGGAISNGRTDILGIVPKAIDDVTPIYVGGKKEIALIEKFMREA